MATHVTINWRESKIILWFLWVFAHIIGGFVGWAVVTVLARFTLGCGGFLAGIILGVCLGAAQGLVLWLYIFNLGRYREWSEWLGVLGWLGWVGLTFTGMFLGSAIAFISLIAITTVVPSLSGTDIVSFLAFSFGGAVFGLAQWGVLHRSLNKSTLWIMANAVGWGMAALIGLYIGDAALNLLLPTYNLGEGIIIGDGDLIHAFISGTVGVTVLGVITGSALVFLLGRPANAPVILERGYRRKV